LSRLGLLDSAGHECHHLPDPEQIRRRREAEATARRQRTTLALDMWHESGPAHGTAVEAYLRARGITLPVPATLRSLSMHGPYGRHPSGARRPQMIALVENIEIGPVAVSRTFLARDGSGKAAVRPVRIFSGPVRGGAVRLGSIRPDRPLVLGEGIETTLSVMQACHLAGWAALSASGIEKVVLPTEAHIVLICADHDANGVGERAARRAAKRFVSEGREVRLALPPEAGTDFADLLLRATAPITGARDVA
jgi:putative DNA primase/helicase